MNTSTRKIVVIVVFLAGLALGYWLFGYSEPVQAESISPVLERLSVLEKSLARIENCACAEPCEYVGVVTRPVYIPITEYLTTTIVITQVIPVTNTIIQLVPITNTTVITVTPMPIADVPTLVLTPVPTQEPMQEPKQHCNQGVGNGPEGCDPGNSNHRHESNDEGSNNRPGNPGRKNEKEHKPKKVRGRSGK